MGPIPEQGRWLASGLRGHFNYYAVPEDRKALRGFCERIIRHWRRALSRRSQKGPVTWEQIRRLAKRRLPNPACCTPGPTRVRRQPKARAQCVRRARWICAGGAEPARRRLVPTGITSVTCTLCHAWLATASVSHPAQNRRASGVPGMRSRGGAAALSLQSREATTDGGGIVLTPIHNNPG